MGLLTPPIDGPARFRELLAGSAPVVAAGCMDPFSARLAERAGFDAVYMTGNGVSAVRLGRPDVGLLTQQEMADQAARIAAAVDVPLVADADTGYGGAANVVRTVREYERAGVAAFHLEDQRMPKRCGHLEGKQLVDAEEHAARIRAAVAGRTNPDTVVIGRTDAVSVEGLDAALGRARAYGEAGADLLFVEGLADAAAVERAASALPEWPLVFAWVEGRAGDLTVDDLAGLGVKVVIFPITAILATMRALERTYAQLRAAGSSVALGGDLAGFEEYSEFLGVDDVDALDQRIGQA